MRKKLHKETQFKDKLDVVHKYNKRTKKTTLMIGVKLIGAKSTKRLRICVNESFSRENLETGVS